MRSADARLAILAAGGALLTLVVIGCRSGAKLPEQAVLENNKKKDAQPTGQAVVLGGGELDQFDEKGSVRERVWTVSWKRAAVDFDLSESKFGGSVEEVAGTIYEDGEPASTFVARNALIARGSKILKLGGGVTVTSKQFDANLTCGEMAYDADTGVVDALGGVRARVGGYLVNEPGVVRIKAARDLSKIGTPKLFNQP